MTRHVPSNGFDLAAAEARLRTATEKADGYTGASEHMRRKLRARVLAAQNEVAIIRYALENPSDSGRDSGPAA